MRAAALAAVLAAVLAGALGSALAAATRPAEFDDRMREGLAHYEARRFSRAIRSFEEALEAAAAPDETVRAKESLASTYGALGTEYFNGGETALARESFETALELAESYFARFGLGYIHFERREDDLALEHLGRSLEQRDDFAGAHKLLAILEYRRGETDEALERLRNAARLDPEDRETAALLARWGREAELARSFADVRSGRFAARVDPAIPRGTREWVLAELTAARESIGDALGFWPEETLVVVLFGEESFHEATGALHWVGGLYDGQLKMPVTVGELDTAARDALRAVVRHEYAHVVVQRMAPECPVWLNEGIAQHFEGPVDRPALAERLRARRGRRLALAEIPTRLWEVEDVELARQSYLQGLGLVEHLVEAHHEFRLGLLLRALTEERSLDRAFTRVYGRPLEEVEAAWWAALAAAEADEGARGE